MSFQGVYKDKRVLLTGHTGFKGAWLSSWLIRLGASVTGVSLPPATQPALFQQLELRQHLRHREADVRDFSVIQAIIEDEKPDFIFHLAAQPLVRASYARPLETYEINIMGTAHVLEAVRLAARPCVLIMITTDKCYENKDWIHSYREEDPLGGHDPYSSSKAGAELVVNAYRRSYFAKARDGIVVASVRAGNVIGGGDWSDDRIVPDCIRALQRREPILVRNRLATRPWQHVLEALSGYLWLGAKMALAAAKTQDSGPPEIQALTSAFNFGPTLESNCSVERLVQAILQHWPGQWVDASDPAAVHEARRLNLAVDKAFHVLQWRPVWTFDQTIQKTVGWYQRVHENALLAETCTSEQIDGYTAAAKAENLCWAHE